ncbi:MAG: MATE family efflux transporter [Butyrivibrio sp.]|jgi:O-antigen/teichoic acid export membrane protein|nr:MATE family efflux transporter [Butyrivibrio sp.]MCR4634762.1 MATE family efflux transporter [Butyrivibrio sp.]
MGSKKRIAINMIAQFITFIINVSINFVLTPYITKHVGKEVYGFVNLAFQTTGYVTIFTSALNAMVGRYITINLGKKDYKNANMYFSSVIVANLIISLALVIPSVFAILYLDRWLQIPMQYTTDVKILWMFIVIDFLLSLCTNCYGVATYASNRLDLAARRNTENTIIRAVSLILMFSIFAPRVWYVGFTKFICGFWIIVTNIYYTRTLVPQLRFNKLSIKFKAVADLVKVGIWNSVQQLSTILINGCDMLITNIYIDAASMTLMGFAKTVPNYLMSIIGIVSGSFGPEMTLLYSKGDMKAFEKYVKSAIKVCGFICSVPILGFITFGTKFFHLWLPTLTSGEVMTVQILSILILAQTIFDVYIYPLYTVNQITTRLRIPVLVSLGIGVANIIGSILLCVYTDLGVYAIQIVSSVLLTARVFFFAPIYASYTLNLKWWTFYGPLLRGALSSAITVVIFYGVLNVMTVNSWFMLVVAAIVCGVIGYTVNYYIVLNKTERIMAKEVIAKKLKIKKK